MAEAAEEIQEEPSLLDLPDDEIDNIPIPLEDESSIPQEEEPVEDTEAPDTTTSPSLEDESEEEIPEEEPEAGAPADKEPIVDLDDAPVEAPEEGEEELVNADDGKVEDLSSDAINYEAEYKRLIAPFRANGKDLQVTGVDDAITLMQMGANYNKKMAGLKPSLKLLKMLEKNDLLDEEAISRLIDLNKKDPAAIKQLIKDSGIDPVDIDQAEEINYKPKTYTVNDSEIDLDGVIADIKDSDTFDETIDTVSNKWDQKSKQVLLNNPKLLGVINDHIGKGYYGSVMGVVENERMLGRLTGMSDIEAYQHVGNAIQALGGFNTPPPPEQESALPATDTASPVKRKPADSKLKDKKRAASSTQSKPIVDPEYNPLSMSDEDFDKLPGGQLL